MSVSRAEPGSPTVSAAGSGDSVAVALGGENPFRRVVEYAPNAIVMIDRSGNVVLVNLQTERLFGYRREDLIGQPIEMLVPERFRQHHGEFRDGFFTAPQPRPMGLGRDLYARRADGVEFPVEIGLNPIDTLEGAMVLASIVDITERQRAKQAVEAALREKTVLLNEVHHRVKNNLQMVSSLLNLQAAAADDPRLRDVINETQVRVRAMALTHQLLYEHKDFSHIDLGEYLDRLTQLLLSAYRYSGRRVSLRPMLRDDQPVFLDLERAIPCGLVVNELVTNAFKHAFPQERSGEILISLVCDDFIEITVADDGVGLPPGFDIASAKSLGFQLVFLLVDQMHGDLRIGPGPGSRFTLRFAARSGRGAP